MNTPQASRPESQQVRNDNAGLPACRLSGLLVSILLLTSTLFPLTSVHAQLRSTTSGGSMITRELQAGAPVALFSNTVATLPNNSTLLLGPGTFTVTPSAQGAPGFQGTNAPLQLRYKTNVVISGAGMTRIEGAGPGYVLSIFNCENVTIQDILFDSNASGYTTNGISGLFGTITLAGTNDAIQIRNVRFTDQWLFCIQLGIESYDRNSNINVDQCRVKVAGATNTWFSGADGGLLGGAAHNLRVTDFVCEQVMRGVEVFNYNGLSHAFTNTVISDGIIKGVGFDGINVVGDVRNTLINNIAISGDTTDSILANAAPMAVKVRSGAINTTINNVSVVGLDGVGISIVCSGTIISNTTVTACSVINSGKAGVGGTGVVVQDDLGGGAVLDGVYVRGCTFSGIRAGDGVGIYGGRNIFVENNSFVDVGNDSIRNGVQTFTGFEIVTNITVRNNRFQNFTASTTMQYAALFHSGCMNCRFEDNFVTNMVVGAVSDASASSTIVGQPFSYSTTMDLGSIPVNQSFTTNFSAPLSRTNFHATLLLPAQFYAANGSSNAIVTAWCSNAVIYLRVSNNDAITAFDPPNTRYRVHIRPMEAY